MQTRVGLVIFGAGGHGRVVASTAQAAGWSQISFIDPGWPERSAAGDWPIESDGSDLSSLRDRAVIVALGDNRRRLALLDELAAAGLEIVTLVHPTAWICPGVSFGPGTVVNARAVVNHGAAIGRGVILNTGAIIEHDCVLGDGVHVSPGAVLAGGVEVGRHGWVGAGASVRQGIRIGGGAIVGVGAAVVADVADDATVAGVPARPLAGRQVQ